MKTLRNRLLALLLTLAILLPSGAMALPASAAKGKTSPEDYDALLVKDGLVGWFDAYDVGNGTVDIGTGKWNSRVGEGVAVSFMDGASIRNRDLYKKLCALAEENGIAWQVKKFISGSNDAGSLQRNNGARATCVLSVPCRYIHSGSNVACFHDIDAQYQLVDAYLTAGGAF